MVISLLDILKDFSFHLSSPKVCRLVTHYKWKNKIMKIFINRTSFKLLKTLHSAEIFQTYMLEISLPNVKDFSSLKLD